MLGFGFIAIEGFLQRFYKGYRHQFVEFDSPFAVDLYELESAGYYSSRRRAPRGDVPQSLHPETITFSNHVTAVQRKTALDVPLSGLHVVQRPVSLWRPGGYEPFIEEAASLIDNASARC